MINNISTNKSTIDVINEIDKLKEYINKSINTIRTNDEYTNQCVVNDKNSYESIFNILTEEKIKRELNQINLLKRYIKIINNCNNIDYTTEIEIGRKIFKDTSYINHKMIDVIYDSNKKILNNIIVDNINNWAPKPGKLPILNSKIIKLTKNPYFTNLELMLIGEIFTKSLIIRWAKTINKDRFSEFLIKNSENINRQIQSYIANSIAKMGFHLKKDQQISGKCSLKT